MKKLIFTAVCLFTISFTTWQSSFEKAMQTAKEKHQLLLLNFSGSDWCGPCIRMRREIFESDVFSKMADTALLLVNADFPRNKKNQLSKEQKAENEALADKYNPDGKFPFTLLIDASGNIVKSWDGLPQENAEEFTRQLKRLCDGRK